MRDISSYIIFSAETSDQYLKQVPLLLGPVYRDITHGTAITVTENNSDYRITKDTPCFALTGELWDVPCEDMENNLPRYNGTALSFERKHC